MTFHAALLAAGLYPRDVQPDGRWYRCATEDKPKKRNGCYKLWPGGMRGFFRNYALHSDFIEWRELVRCQARGCGHDQDHGRRTCEKCGAALPVSNYGMSPELQRQVKESRERDRQRRVEAIRGARAYWDGARPTMSHPYLEAKGLSIHGAIGLRARDGFLLIPMMRESLLSIQKISADGEKLFWPGAPTRGTSFEIPRARASVTCICEGYATGLAVFQCVPQARVVITFDSGNLLPAIEHLGLHGTVVVCADNDHGTLARRGFNPGLIAAQKVADAIGCGVAYPTDIEGTDWADALKEWGERAPSRIQREILRGAKSVRRAREPMEAPMD